MREGSILKGAFGTKLLKENAAFHIKPIDQPQNSNQTIKNTTP